jgi:uncharacterized protein YkwD
MPSRASRRAPAPRVQLAARLARILAVTAVLVSSLLASTPVAFAARHRSAAPKVSATGTRAPCANTGLEPTTGNLAEIDAATLCLVNHQRALHHEHPLRDNADLHAAALGHSEAMVTGDYFDHVDRPNAL